MIMAPSGNIEVLGIHVNLLDLLSLKCNRFTVVRNLEGYCVMFESCLKSVDGRSKPT